jgi:predicted ATP-binding protein involved in virulence
MRIYGISTKGLFGMFDHEVLFNIDTRVTIIHGPNGVGKTTLLKIIDAVFNKQSEELRSVPFDEFSTKFTNKSVLSITKKHPEQEEIQQYNRRNDQFKFDFQQIGQKKESWKSNLRFDPREMRVPFSLIERIVPNLERVGPTRWLDTNLGEVLNYEQVFQKYSTFLPSDFRYLKNDWPEWLNKCLEDVSVRFVRAQRLLLLPGEPDGTHFRTPSENERRSRVSEAVLSYSSQLRDIIRQRLAESSLLSQSLDRTFPQRLIESYRKKKMIPQDELIERLNRVEEKRNFLIRVGLYDPEKVNIRLPEVGDQTIQSVLSVYVQDAEEKLQIFDELAAKIDLLLDLINSHFQYKQMKIDKEKGFIFETDRGLLSPANLSSGEQHELVLIYELLFQTKRDTLVLIDEPELSLHVGWQIRFLEDLQKIINLAQIDTLVATHSPSIINNRWDLTIKLGGENA